MGPWHQVFCWRWIKDTGLSIRVVDCRIKKVDQKQQPDAESRAFCSEDFFQRSLGIISGLGMHVVLW